MANYIESKKVIDKIAEKYSCSGNLIMRTAFQYLLEHGVEILKDDKTFNDRANQIDGDCMIDTACLNCARELAEIPSYDLLIYIQKEMFWSNDGGLDYSRAIALLKRALEYLEDDNCNCVKTYGAFRDIGLRNSEIEELGFDYLLNVIESNEEE